MARATILTHDRFMHRASGVLFLPALVPNEDGHKVWLGVAEVDEAVAREHFVDHPSFRVEGLSDEPSAPPAPPAIPESTPSADSSPDTPPSDAGAPAGSGSESSSTPEPLTLEKLEAMSYNDLRATAKERKLELPGNTPKDKLLAALVASLSS